MKELPDVHPEKRFIAGRFIEGSHQKSQQCTRVHFAEFSAINSEMRKTDEIVTLAFSSSPAASTSSCQPIRKKIQTTWV